MGIGLGPLIPCRDHTEYLLWRYEVSHAKNTAEIVYQIDKEVVDQLKKILSEKNADSNAIILGVWSSISVQQNLCLEERRFFEKAFLLNRH